ncbi:LmbU family transcriptional regulator [Streptomyces sp. NPDC020965]|uniref:LmbU family transcriptional regulator n=1 Tax=Streptomyces sp. NPDC020965 TaxID=3365105 RepID=UPI0037A29251
MNDISPPSTLVQQRRLLTVGVLKRSGGDRLTVPKAGLEFPPKMPFDSWLEIGAQLSTLATSSAWCLGDWLNYGEASYVGRYREAIEHSSLDYQTLRNYAWVTRKFALHRRRENLSFGHHAEVAALPEPEQDFWLQKAEDLRWSRNQLRRQIRASLSERESERSGPSSEGAPVRKGGVSNSPTQILSVRLNLSQQQMETCLSAADRAGVSFEDWALRVLDQTARTELSGTAQQ